jgi:hypothetical protein
MHPNMGRGHEALWRKLFNPATNLLYDLEFTDPAQYPTPEAAAQSQPSCAGWGTGMEDCTLTAGFVLDVVWALRRFRECGADEQFVFDLFGLPSNPESKKLAAAALNPAKSARVYYFEREHGTVLDISNLDPGSVDAAEAGWGGLTEFSGHVGNLVARAVAIAEA